MPNVDKCQGYAKWWPDAKATDWMMNKNQNRQIHKAEKTGGFLRLEKVKIVT